ECVMACDTHGDVISEIVGERLSLNEESAAKWVITEGYSLMLNDALSDDRHYTHPSLPSIGSEMVLLLQDANEILGVLIVQCEEKNSFSVDDNDVIKGIADQLATAIY